MRHKIDPELKLLISRECGIPQLSPGAAGAEPAASGLAVDVPRVKVLVSFQDSLEPATAIGFEVGLTAGNVTTGSIPLDRIEALAALDNVLAVDAYRTLRPHLKYSAADVHATQVHQGKLPSIQAYDGSGVVVGIIDDGIDFRHPAFRHKDVTQSTRILKLWIGQDSYDAAAINQAMNVTDKDDPRYIPPSNGSHGTHVAGIAAGCDDSFGYLGMAPGADLMIGDMFGDWIGAIDKIATAAAALGKRAVINMSLGGSGSYPCDADPTAQLIGNYLSAHPDLIIAASAGNSGADGQHVEGTLANGVCEFQFNVQEGDTHKRVVYFWHDAQESFDLEVTSPSGHVSQRITPNTNDVFRSPLSKPLPRGLDLDIPPPAPPQDVLATAKIAVAMSITQPNPLCRLMLSFEPEEGAALPPGVWKLKLTGTVQSNPIIHGWVDADTGGSLFKQARFVGGDGRGTMEIPALIEQVIAVGSYATSTEHFGSPGKFSFFSSQGPLFTAALNPDSLIKPEIAAPGQGIISARSENAHEAPYNWSPQWMVSSGTSMASPHVTGAIALLLQKEPNLSRQQVRDRLQQSARKDSFTGPALPDFKWGHGKLDVWKLLHPNEPAPAKAESAESLDVSAGQAGLLAGSAANA